MVSIEVLRGNKYISGITCFDKVRKEAVVRFLKEDEAMVEDFVRNIEATIEISNGGFNNPEKLFKISW